MCWYPLFVRSVIAVGFPIRERKQGKGLEISPVVMASLAGVAFPVEYDGGLILKGLSTILIPAEPLDADGAVQWHLRLISKDQQGVIRLVPTGFKVSDLEQVWSK